MRRTSRKQTFDTLAGRDLATASVMFNHAVAQRLGMSAPEWRCVELLSRLGPVPASRLAQLSGLSGAAVTGIVDRLERTGHVRREADPDDRRKVIVARVPHPEFDLRVRRLFARFRRSFLALNAEYTDRELALIGDYLGRLTEILRDETRALHEREPARRRRRPVRDHESRR